MVGLLVPSCRYLTFFFVFHLLLSSPSSIALTYRFGTIKCIGHPLEQLDSARLSTSSAAKGAIEIAMDMPHLDLLQLPEVKGLLGRKWDCFAERRFVVYVSCVRVVRCHVMFVCVQQLSTILLTSMSIILDPCEHTDTHRHRHTHTHTIPRLFTRFPARTPLTPFLLCVPLLILAPSTTNLNLPINPPTPPLYRPLSPFKGSQPNSDVPSPSSPHFPYTP